MMRRITRKLILLAAVVAAFAAMQGAALAAPGDGPVGPGDGAFLCPAVGDGVAHASEVNDDNGVQTIGQIASEDYSFLPGKNQAGANANGSAQNAEGPESSPGPGGGNSEWSPIWPAA